MYEEYGKFYREYVAKYGSKTAIFLMVGAFYELYDVQDKETGLTHYNVKEVTDLLGIQLTIKKDDSLFAGIPDYTLHKHAARLTASWRSSSA